MGWNNLKENLCTSLVLKWKRFIVALGRPCLRVKADCSLSLCRDESETEPEAALKWDVDTEIKLCNLLAFFAGMALVCSLLRTLFGRK